ncbi:MAG: fused DSP-PTPase phosphatase/NAD kinase-like protein, partial [Actinomycetota bacterium]
MAIPFELVARRLARTGVIAVAIYLAAVIVVQLVLFAGVGVARLAAGDPRSDEVSGVANFRKADDRVWFGAQPGEEGYRELAARGVTTVIDLRTGADDDEHQADPRLLRTLGIDRRVIPVPDGHGPTRSDVRRLLAAIDRAEGVVFVHCGGG